MTGYDKRVFGIDLGTTQSCIACVDDTGQPVVLTDSQGAATTPSVVYFDMATKEQVLVGNQAAGYGGVYPNNTVALVKRSMGQDVLFSPVGWRAFKPQEVAAYILRELVKGAEALTGRGAIRDVVITHPAYFGIAERKATEQAGEIAGLNVRGMIPEPTAAALCYSWQRKVEHETVLVYDLGGGTFDVSVVKLEGPRAEVICVDGDHDLGGADWDRCVANWIAQQRLQREDIDGLEAEDRYGLLELAERAKLALTGVQSFPVQWAVKVNRDVNRDVIHLTRDEFDRITAPLLGSTILCVQRVLARAKQKGHDRIDKILLVGGSSYMGQVRQGVMEEFGKNGTDVRAKIEIVNPPHLVVAKGAALLGHWIGSAGPEGREQEAGGAGKPERGFLGGKVQDVTAKSFGVVVIDEETGNRVVSNLICGDTKLPAEAEGVYYTAYDNQVTVEMICMENSARDRRVVGCDESTEIGRATLVLAKPRKKGRELKVYFVLTRDGMLTATATEMDGGAEVKVEIAETGALTRAQIKNSRTEVTAR